MNMLTLEDGELLATISVCIINTAVRDLPTEYSTFKDVFNEGAAAKLSEFRPSLDHEIILKPDTTAPYSPLYNLSQTELEVLQDYIETNLTSGFIRCSKSSSGAPIVFVKRKDGSLRLCVNYCGLNAITIRNQYPLPLIPEIMD